MEILPGYFCTLSNGCGQRLGFQSIKWEMLFADPHWEEMEIRVVCLDFFID